MLKYLAATSSGKNIAKILLPSSGGMGKRLNTPSIKFI